MKKIIIISLISVFVFSLFGCSTKKNTTNIGIPSTVGKTVGYKDGVYNEIHKSTKPGYEEAVVTIKNKKIQNINLKRLDANKKEINYNDWDGTKGGRPNLKQDRLVLAKAMVDKQSSNVNAISGATQSSDGWKAAVSTALSKAH
jgi:uncharacterized protein with FMN-binding domain